MPSEEIAFDFKQFMQSEERVAHCDHVVHFEIYVGLQGYGYYYTQTYPLPFQLAAASVMAPLIGHYEG